MINNLKFTGRIWLSQNKNLSWIEVKEDIIINASNYKYVDQFERKGGIKILNDPIVGKKIKVVEIKKHDEKRYRYITGCIRYIEKL